MASLLRFGAQFAKETWGAMVAAVAAVTSPLEQAKALGFVSQDTQWLLGAEGMRAVFAAFAIMWMFVWFVRKQTKFETQFPGKRIPLREALWYLAENAEWGTASKLSAEDWEKRVIQELHDRLSYGDIMSWGVHRYVTGGGGDRGPSDIPTTFWKAATATEDWKISDPDNPYSFAYAVIDGRSENYTEIMIDEAALKALYPPRGWLSKWFRKTPIETIPDRSEIKHLQQHPRYAPATPLEHILGE